MSCPWVQQNYQKDVEPSVPGPQAAGTVHRYETCSLFVSCMANSFTFSDAQLTAFLLKSKEGGGMPPTTEDLGLEEPAEEPSDPPLPTFTQEPPTTDIMEDLGLEEPSPTPLPSTFAKPCPVPGCSKIIKKMWNHLFQVHKPQGQYTGMRHAVYSYHVWLTVLHFQMLS